MNPCPALQYFNVPSDHQAVPADQLSILLGVQQPSSLNITGSVTLSFNPDQGVPLPSNSNPQVGFLEGRTISATHSYSVPPNCALPNCGQPLTLQAGNVAGSITMHVTSLTTSDPNLPPGLLTPDDQTITMPKLIPSVDPAQISIRNIAGGFEVCIPGFSTPRDMTTAAFRFVPADKANLRVPPEPHDVAGTFASWYQDANSLLGGSNFTYVQPITVQGDASRSRLPIRYSNELGGLHRRVRTNRYSKCSTLQRGVLVRCKMSPSPDANQPNPPPDQPPVPDSPPPSPTGLSFRDSPKLLAFAAALTLITALYFYYVSYPLDPPSLVVVGAVWLIAGWGLHRMFVYWKSSRKARH